MPRTARFAVPVFVASFALGGVVVAQQDSGRPVLHEFFVYTNVPPSSDDGALPALPEPGRAGDSGAPSAGNAAAPLGPGAGLTLTPGGPVPSPGFFEEQSGGLRNGPGTSEGDVTLDDDTGLEGMLRYAEAFDPSVAPWKRSSARDAVFDDGGTLSIGVRNQETRPVSVGGAPPEGSDTFTGRFSILASPGTPIPIPSVAPNMVVHAVETSPRTSVTVERDGADNYFVTTTDGGAFEVVMEVSAPRSYFGGPLPTNSAALGPPLVGPDIVTRVAPVLGTIGVHRGMTERAALTRLVAWFRNFDARPLPADQRTGDLYADITRLQLGVCRHRAQAFVISAAALGLPARYVHNEAHAFVEVRFAGGDWRRVDLGGGSAGLEIYGDATSQHTPPPDPLHDPAAGSQAPYEEQRSDRVGTESDGGQPGSGSDGETSGQSGGSSGEAAPSGDHEEMGATAGAPTDDGEGAERVMEAAPYEGSGFAIEPGNTGASGGEGGEGGPAVDPAVPTQLSLAVSARRAYRGEPVRVSGTLSAAGVTTGGRRVVLELTRDDGVTVSLGTAETDARGAFSLEATVPPAAFAGAWDLRARFAGDDALLASEAR